jgi:hypothetical protein
MELREKHILMDEMDMKRALTALPMKSSKKTKAWKM